MLGGLKPPVSPQKPESRRRTQPLHRAARAAGEGQYRSAELDGRG